MNTSVCTRISAASVTRRDKRTQNTKLYRTGSQEHVKAPWIVGKASDFILLFVRPTNPARLFVLPFHVRLVSESSRLLWLPH
jgi:hypothetical protein